MARVLFQSGDYAETKDLVKPRAFLPRHGETSVAEITDLGEDEILDLVGRVEELRKLVSKARGELSESAIEAADLAFVRDDADFDGHGNLVGWSTEGADKKARNLSIAQQLSSRARLVMHHQ